MYQPPTFCATDDVLSRAEKEREREINQNAVDDMCRVEDEYADVILGLEALVKDGWTVGDALAKTREALALVKKQRANLEQHL